MKSSEQVLVERYAIAYTNMYRASLTSEMYVHMNQACLFLEQHPKFLFMLHTPSISLRAKLVWCAQFIKEFSLPFSLYQLCSLLISGARGDLLADVLHAIGKEHERRSGVIAFTITVSHDISPQKLDVITEFLKRHTGHTVVCEVKKDPSLIAGIRMQSNDLLWEHSVRKNLHTALLSLIH